VKRKDNSWFSSTKRSSIISFYTPHFYCRYVDSNGLFTIALNPLENAYTEP